MSAAAIKALSSPQGRQLMRTLGVGIVKATGNSRARRANRGKYYVGKKVGIPPKIGYRAPRKGPANTSSVQAMPAAYNVASTSTSGRNRLVKREKVDWDFSCSSDDNGDPAAMRVSPLENIFFPILSTMCKSYTRFKFISLAIEYVPRTGTSTNGTVYFGWQPQPSYESNNDAFPNVQAIASMPKNATTSVRQGMTFSIPITGGEKFIAVPNSSPSFDPLNYFNGFFIATAQGDADPHIGDLWVRYVVDLIEPVRDKSVQTTRLDLVARTVTKPGSYNASAMLEGDTTVYSVFSMRPVTVLVRSFADSEILPDTPTINDQDGNPIVPAWDVGEAKLDHGHRLTGFRLPANGTARHRFSCVLGANNTIAVATVFQTVSYL